MNKIEQAKLIEKYRNASKKLVLLDYDGTLVKHELIPDNARPSEHLYDILIKLSEEPQTKLFIITGRSHQNIEKLLNYIPLNFIAEHGAMYKENGNWKSQINDECIWKKTAIPILTKFVMRCPNSFIEEKTFSLTWHYRNVESESGYKCSRELIRMLEEIIGLFYLKILDGNKVVEIMNKEIGKGNAVKHLLEKNRYDFILSIGNDVTDEEMFELLFHNSNAFTIKVGNGDTFARYKLDGINDVVSLLKLISV